MTNPDQIRARAMGIDYEEPVVDVCEQCGTDRCVPYEVHEKVINAFNDLCHEVAESDSGQAVFNAMALNIALSIERKRVKRLTWWLAVAALGDFWLVLWMVTR